MKQFIGDPEKETVLDGNGRMSKLLDVQTGEVKVSRGKIILRSSAVGSCVVVVAYDAKLKVGGLAHIMLPGIAPAGRKASERSKYAVNGINAMLAKMTRLGCSRDDIGVVLVGGANVLQRKDDMTWKNNIDSVLEALQQEQLKVRAQAIGGVRRRSVSLDLEHGAVLFSEGDSTENRLWKAGNDL